MDEDKFSYEGMRKVLGGNGTGTPGGLVFPGSNFGSGWTAQIKVGKKLLGQDGKFYNYPSNITHIPVEGIKK